LRNQMLSCSELQMREREREREKKPCGRVRVGL
jgi:hypothetical protein